MEITITIAVITVTAYSILIYAFIRNHYVYKECQKMINKIYATENWKQNRKILDEISYNKMLLTFWKPVKSFYKNITLLK